MTDTDTTLTSDALFWFSKFSRTIQERDTLLTENAKLREALEKAAKLLEALRVDSGIGNILGSLEKEVYASIEMEINAILAKQEGK